MDRIKPLLFLANIYKFKIIKDKNHIEYVVFENSNLCSIDGTTDKTQFEAVENHIHLLDKIRKKEYFALFPIAQELAKSLLSCLKEAFPDKHFCVYATLTLKDSFIIRFHQKWPHEEPYYDLNNIDESKEKIFFFEN
ncbi:MAG: hypothetical protein E7388_04485 [Ruminococcaceae bacterium]|nr:hypothetical protein [Oscillospiraceae bacterium]